LFESLQLDRQLQLGLDSLGHVSPSPVQAELVPLALTGKDIKISAETGSGKTLAYLIPLAQRILSTDITGKTGTLALILVPTRELARQVQQECRKLLAKTPLRVQAITGGADFKYQRSVLRKDPEILIATPGRLLEHCQHGSTDLAHLQCLVLDEADRMLDMGFREDVLAINDFCAPSRQVLLLSATLKHRGVTDISSALIGEYETVAIGSARQAHTEIRHQRVLADGVEHKNKLLQALAGVENYRRILVFANKRTTAQRLGGLLHHHGLRAECLTGEMSTEDRKKVMTRFRDGKIDILCASDVAARGLDVPEIDLVVNYDLPHSGDDYLHRTGRTARAGAQGEAVSLIDASQWNLMISIQRYLKLEFENRSLPGLKARFQGPRRQKSSGKAAGSKKKRDKNKADKSKTRKRNQKNVGKRRQATPVENDGFAPLMKKKNPE
jgi:superfamily II DNA/RNA helicase